MTDILIISTAIFGIGMVIAICWSLMGPKAVAKLIVATIAYTAALVLVLFGVLVATFLERVFQ